MPKTKVEVYDKDQLIYPYIESDHVTFSNGMKVSEMLDQSISMPKVIHENLSFKVGVGDQDVSSAIVNSSVAEMTIKGKTYQNILPEPSTHVLTNNKEMFKVNEGLDPNVEIVDGVSKSAILSGQTKYRDEDGDVHDSFVQIPNEGNLYKGTRDFNTTYWEFGAGAKPLEPFELDPNFKQATLTSDYQHLTTPTSKQGFMFDNPNKTWTISAMFKGSQQGQTIGITLDAGRVEYDKKPVINGQWTRITWTFQGSTTLQKFRFENKSLQGEIKVAQVMVTETDHEVDWKPALRDGEYKSLELISCEMPVLKTTGKNLFDGKLENGFLSDSTGQPNGGNKHKYTPSFIKIDASKKYCLHAEADSFIGIVNAYYYDYNKNYLGFGRDIIVGINTNISKLFTPHYSNASYIRFRFFKPNNVELPVDPKNIAFYESSTIIDMYEPHKTNILSTPEEVVLRSLPNGVKDTLNLNTGEYVQRIGEVVLDGSEAWNKDTTTGGTKDNTSIFHTEANFNGFKPSPNVEYRDTMMLCDKIPVKGRVYNLDEEGLMINGDGRIYIRINLSRLETNNAGGFKSFLAKENIKIQCELATPVIKTVDLSSSGNWEKIVLDGSENWTTTNDAQNQNSTMFFRLIIPNILPTNVTSEKGNLWSDMFVTTPSGSATGTWGLDTEAISVNTTKALDIRILKSKLPTQDVAGFKTWLSENPVTVWYQTATHQDSTQVKQPIFFKDGHIIQSSGADYSLIPTLDYQAKTSNSYVMDLMKTNTLYTMKCSNPLGGYTIDGIVYNFVSNRTFNSPSTFTNKLLVATGSATDLMIIEGDLTSKTIPYFKGIKSAFEGEDKIEVLSIGKNLFDGELELATIGTETGEKRPSSNNVCSVNFIKVKPSTTVVLTNNNGYIGVIHEYDKNYNYIKYTSSATEITKTTLTTNTEYVLIRTTDSSRATDLSTKFLLEVADSKTDYEPYKSNNTKVPLLWNKPSTHKHYPQMEFGELDRNTGDNYNGNGNSNLRSVNHLELKDKLIAISFYNDDKPRAMNIAYYDADKNFISFSYADGTAITAFPSNAKYIRFYLGNKNANNLTVVQTYLGEGQLVSLPNNVRDEIILDRENNKAKIVQRANKIILDGSENGWFKTTYVSGEVVEFAIPCTNVNGLGLCNNMMIYGDTERIVYASDKIYIRILKTKANNIETFRNHLQSNPTVVYYELATPVITEVDLEGFPYIYKDGHIFINNEIAPTMEITYSINQGQQISASNEDIIRHEKELTYLQKLIAQYIQVDYESALLSLKV